MPHKRNPIVSERVCGLARVVRAAAQVGLDNVALWHERDISHSSAERVVIPDAFLALDYMLDKFTWLMSGLVVDARRMRANVDSQRGLVASQAVLSALVSSGIARDDAYRMVQTAAMNVHGGGAINLGDALRELPEVVGAIGDQLDDLLACVPPEHGVATVFARLPASR
jgi:adenylosuccinate lyase